MSTAQAIILAIIEGITEFLPISSTGHMIIASSFMDITDSSFAKVFVIVIQFGAILSVVVLYKKYFFISLSFYYKLFIAFIPAAIVGLLFSGYIDRLLERVDVVAAMLIIGGVIFLFIDKIFNQTNKTRKEEISYFSAFKIGIFQTLAMIPGVSRSAASIIGGLTQKLDKKTATEFSFFLAVPTMLAATVYKLLMFYLEGETFSPEKISILLIGNAVAFITALFAIKFFIALLTRYGFKFFGYYRIALGSIILIMYCFDIKVTLL